MFTIPSQSRTFIEEGFRNEAEIEQVFFEHYQVLLGANVVLLPKSGIQTTGGAGTIPDAYAFDLDNNTWYLIEVELLHHGVWQHIVRQVSMQLTAARDSRSQEKILDKAVELYERDERIRGIVQEKEIKEIHLRKRLGDILKKEPLIGYLGKITSNRRKNLGDQKICGPEKTGDQSLLLAGCQSGNQHRRCRTRRNRYPRRTHQRRCKGRNADESRIASGRRNPLV
jgi:hypothetical protein